MQYCDFISLPYFKEISLRKVVYSRDNKIPLGRKIQKVLKEMDQKIEEADPSYLSEL